jgi:hypothetical protein
MPSSSSKTTSDGTPRIVDAIGATLTVDKYPMALPRVSTTTGLFLSGNKLNEPDIASRYSGGHTAFQAIASSRACGLCE